MPPASPSGSSRRPCSSWQGGNRPRLGRRRAPRWVHRRSARGSGRSRDSPLLATIAEPYLTRGPRAGTPHDPDQGAPEAKPGRGEAPRRAGRLLVADQREPVLPLPAFAAGALSALTSTVAAVMRYSIVTFAPTLRSPVTLVAASRPISQRSLPFCTTIMSLVSSSTGPVTW